MAPQIVVNFAKAAVPAAKPVIRSQGRRILSGAFDILKNLGKGGASKAKGFGSAVKQAVTPGPVTQFFGKAAGGALRATGPISAAAGLGTGATIVSMAALGGTSPEEVAKQSRVDLTKYGVGDKYEVEGYGRLQGVGSFLLNQGAKFSGQDPASYSERSEERRVGKEWRSCSSKSKRRYFKRYWYTKADQQYSETSSSNRKADGSK